MIKLPLVLADFWGYSFSSSMHKTSGNFMHYSGKLHFKCKRFYAHCLKGFSSHFMGEEHTCVTQTSHCDCREEAAWRKQCKLPAWPVLPVGSWGYSLTLWKELFLVSPKLSSQVDRACFLHLLLLKALAFIDLENRETAHHHLISSILKKPLIRFFLF